MQSRHTRLGPRHDIATIAAFGLIFALGCAAEPLVPLDVQLAARITASDAETVGLYFLDLDTRDSVTLDADVLLHAASTMKVPVMIQAFRDADEGRVALNQMTPVVNSFRSIVDGSPYSLTPADDSDSALYHLVGQRVELLNLIDRMITKSSNLATNMMIQIVGAERANATAQALGADSIHVLRGVEDIRAYEAGLSNRITARDMGALLAAIAEGRAASDSSSRMMLDILSRQHFRDGIPAGLPPETQVAHKTGFITRINHDGGIVYLPDGRRYVLVVLTRGVEDPAAADRLIADLSRITYEFVVQHGDAAPS